MEYFVTGATGFIGRNLVERLLQRDGQIHVLVREGSERKLDALLKLPENNDRIVFHTGDLLKPNLGISDADTAALKGKIDHFFHLAALYDMQAKDELNTKINVDGTGHTVEFANAIEPGIFHHVSSIAVAGDYDGTFREDYFDQGQDLPSAYHKTKFLSEKLVRELVVSPWRVYRPGVVVGDSRTGEIDKVDGPYYFFKAIQKLRAKLPSWVPLAAPELGDTNIVPVNYVADALDHIAHEPELDQRAFHLVSPTPQRSTEVINIFAKAAHAPQIRLRVEPTLLKALPKGPIMMLSKLPAFKGVRRAALEDWGVPDEILGHISLTPVFDSRDAERALEGTGITVPPLDTYATKIWDYWERNLDPDLFKDRTLRGAVEGKTALITGASSGIGRAAALKLAEAGAIVLLVSRTEAKLREVQAEVERDGGSAHVYPTDLDEHAEIDAMVERVLADHGHVDILVNNAGKSIRRSLELSYDRFFDFERLMRTNYFGPLRLIMDLLPSMREHRRGHIINVSSIGVQTNPPRFSAYVASKAALDAWTKIAATETLGDHVTFTTIHMPLVRTPMIAPTKIYDSLPTISPEQAAEMICEAARTKPKHIGTGLGTFGEVSYALMPKAVDQILHMGYKVFPDSAAARGKKDPKEAASAEQVAFGYMMKGVHW